MIERDRPGSTALQKVLAILEVMAIFTTGQIVVFLVVKVAGLTPANPLHRLAADTTPGELLGISWELLQVLLLQYGGWFVLILPIGWWHRRRRFREYGVTTAGKPLGSLALTGVVLFCIADLPVKVLDVIDKAVGLGEDVPWRTALFAMDWTSWQFWLLMAIGSYALIPLVEELFYRGYMQGRLTEDLGPAAAILAVGLLFTLSHSQYHIANLLNIARIPTLLFSAIAWGYVYYRTRSLVPTIVAHALINIPIRDAYLWIQLPVMLAVCVVARRPILSWVKSAIEVFASAPSHGTTVLAGVLFAAFALAFVYLPNLTPIFGLAAFVAILVLIPIDRRRRAASTLETEDGPSPRR